MGQASKHAQHTPHCGIEAHHIFLFSKRDKLECSFGEVKGSHKGPLMMKLREHLDLGVESEALQSIRPMAFPRSPTLQGNVPIISDTIQRRAGKRCPLGGHPSLEKGLPGPSREFQASSWVGTCPMGPAGTGENCSHRWTQLNWLLCTSSLQR